MAINNVRIMPYNYAEFAECPTEIITNPSSNILTDFRFERLVTSSGSQHEIKFKINTTGRRIRCIGLNHQLYPYDEITIELYDNYTYNTAGTVFDSGTHRLMPVITDSNWHSSELSSGYLLDDFNNTKDKLYLNFDMDVVAQSGKITLDLGSAAAASFNYLYAGDYIETDINVDSSYSSYISHETDEATNNVGDSFFNTGAKYNNIIVDWNLLTEHERQRFKYFSKDIGRNKKILMSVNPGAGDYAENTDRIWGTIQNDIVLTRRPELLNPTYSASVHVREPIES